MQPFVVVVGTHAGGEDIVPAVYAAQQIVTFHPPVGEVGAAVEAASVEHRVIVVPTHDYRSTLLTSAPTGVRSGRSFHWVVATGCMR